MREFLHWLAGYLRLRVIEGPLDRDTPCSRGELESGGKPLFERYLLCRLPFGCAIYVHHYLRSDPDRGPHDHPWRWMIVWPLSGGYTEERLVRFDSSGLVLAYHVRRPGLPYLLDARDFHRVLTRGGVTSWSVFVHGPKVKPWGFLRVDKDAWPKSPVKITYTNFVPQSEPCEAWARSALTGRESVRAAP